MKFLFSLVLIIGGLCGIAVSFLSNIVANSSLAIFDGLELSIWFGLFSIVVFINGIHNLLSAG